MDNIAEVFSEQQHLVNEFFLHLDHDAVERFSEKIINCQGLIFLTGMGKSGIIAKNISQMLVSTGVRAMFLDPVNALHGDVGVITPNDLVVLFSRSGQTGELVNLIPAIKSKKAYTVAVISNIDGLLGKLCHEMIHLPLVRELCPFDLAPTTSSIIQLIFGNTVVAYLMKSTGLTKEEYARNHPAGRIGKRLTVRVEDVMKPVKSISTCRPDDTLIDQISHMSAKRCGTLLVTQVNEVNGLEQLLGIFTDGDLRRAIESHGNHALSKTMNELMTKNPTTTKISVMAFTAMQEMERVDQGKKRVKELPVTDSNGMLKGLLLLHDLVQFGL